MSHPRLLSYEAIFECNSCGRHEFVTQVVDEIFTSPSQRYCITYMDLLEDASQNDFLVDDNGKMICFNCVEKKHIEASLPTIAEHNPSLKGAASHG